MVLIWGFRFRKWDRITMDALYLVVIVLRDDLSSIRDLNETHIPYLEQMRDKILDIVPRKYGVDANQLKIYFHCK
jgi:m7GpppX diphosphatase